MSAPCILSHEAAGCLRSCNRKSAIPTFRHTRKKASETFSGLTSGNTRSVGRAPFLGTESRTWQASTLNQTVRPSPFLVCGNRIRPPRLSTSSQRSPSNSERRMPVKTSRATMGRSHWGACFEHDTQFCGLQVTHAASRSTRQLYSRAGIERYQLPLDGEIEHVFQGVQFLDDRARRDVCASFCNVLLHVNAANSR